MIAAGFFTAAELAEHRADARSLMGAENGSSTGVIVRKGPREDIDQETGQHPSPWRPVHNPVPGRLQAARSSAVTIGGVEYEQATGELDLPHDLYDLRDGDHYDVTTGSWAGTVYRVVKAVKGDQLPCRRIPVEEVTRPTDWPETWPDPEE